MQNTALLIAKNGILIRIHKRKQHFLIPTILLNMTDINYCQPFIPVRLILGRDFLLYRKLLRNGRAKMVW